MGVHFVGRAFVVHGGQVQRDQCADFRVGQVAFDKGQSGLRSGMAPLLQTWYRAE